MSSLVSLDIENVLRLKAVHIEPGGKPVVVIGGNNGQGKTSILNSLEYALGGKPDVERPIRDGETSARIVVETDDLIIKRVFTAKGSRLEVQAKAGELRHTIKSPQALLDKMIGQLAFDPLAFSRMNAKAQVETLKALVGVDFSGLDASREKAFEDRTLVNREVKALRAQAEGMPTHPEAPTEEVSVSELAEELERRTEQNRLNDEQRRQLDEAVRDEEQLRHSVDDIENDLAEIRGRLEQEKEKLAAAIKQHAERGQLVAGLAEAKPDEIRDQLRNAEAANIQVRENEKRFAILSQVDRKETEVQAFSNRIVGIDREKDEILAQAEFRVDGLAFAEHGVTFKGMPWKQCSTAEQLRVSVAMGLAMNQDLKLMLIRDGSVLDTENLCMIEEMARAAGATIMIERVGDGAEVSVVIEDGMVKELRDDVALKGGA